MKKPTSSTPAELETIAFSDSIADYPSIKWLYNNGNAILWGILSLFILAMLVYRWSGNHAQNSEKDYLMAENAFLAFEKELESSPGFNEANLNQLAIILEKHPELHSKYDARIAQLLLIKGANQEAIPYADRTFARVSQDRLTPYLDFAQTTLLISQKQYAEALQHSLNLKTTLLDEAAAYTHASSRSFGDYLYLANLVRIATLENQLGDHKKEAQSWEELKQIYLQPSAAGYNIDPQAVSLFFDQLAEGKVSLLDFIKSQGQIKK